MRQHEQRRQQQARKQGQHERAADDDDGERALRLAADAAREGRREQPDERDRGRHQHGPQTALGAEAGAFL